jgi:hypothetical protein
MESMSWELPNEEQFNQEVARTPVRIPDLAPGHFKGCIEEVIIYEDEHGKPVMDNFGLAIRIVETDNPSHVGKIMSHALYLRTKRGTTNPHVYKFLTSLIPGIKDGDAWHPSDLMMTVFTSRVEYTSKKYWNFIETKFDSKNEDFGV